MTTRDFQTRKPIPILFSYFKPHRGLFILDLSARPSLRSSTSPFRS